MSKAQGRILSSSKSEKAFQKKTLQKKDDLTPAQIKRVLNPKYKGTLVRDSNLRESWGQSSKEIRTLSEPLCGQIALYYRRAVQKNSGNVQQIIRAIHAIPYHLGANDSNAAENHRFFPDNSESWCRYNAAIYSSREPISHPNFISEKCVNTKLHLFKEFGYDTEEFVKRLLMVKPVTIMSLYTAFFFE